MGADGRIVALSNLEDQAGARERIREIFAASSQVAPSLAGAEADNFYRLYAGIYLERWPEATHVYLGAEGEIAGYLSGCLDSAGAESLLDGIFFYSGFYCHYRDFPAHFHVNCDPSWRNRGLGAALVNTYLAQCRAAGLPGVHLVTGASARNRNFYERCGFILVEHRRIGEKDVVLLGQGL